MKKLLIAAALAGVTTGAFAQGTIAFNNTYNNYSLPAVDYNGTFAPAGGFSVALYWLNQSSGPLTPINAATATAVFHGTAAASAGSGAFSFASDVVVPGQAVGGTGEFEVAAWLGTTYTSYGAAVAAGDPHGTSAPFYNATGGDGTPANPGKALTGWTGQPDIILASTPEPTTIALGGLGAAALLLFRRRK